MGPFSALELRLQYQQGRFTTLDWVRRSNSTGYENPSQVLGDLTAPVRYVVAGSTDSTPLSLDELRQAILGGKMKYSDRVRAEYSSEWVDLYQLLLGVGSSADSGPSLSTERVRSFTTSEKSCAPDRGHCTRETQNRKTSQDGPNKEGDSGTTLPAISTPQSSGSQRKRREWKAVTREEAKKHHLYGAKNWLAVFLAVFFFGTVGQLGTLNSQAREAGITLIQMLSVVHPAMTAVKATLVINLLAFVIIVGLFSVKHKSFRLAASGVLVARVLLTLLVGVMTPDEEMGSALAQGFITQIVWGSVWIAYLNLSKRVRVTFENTVLVE